MKTSTSTLPFSVLGSRGFRPRKTVSFNSAVRRTKENKINDPARRTSAKPQYFGDRCIFAALLIRARRCRGPRNLWDLSSFLLFTLPAKGSEKSGPGCVGSRVTFQRARASNRLLLRVVDPSRFNPP